MSEHYPMEFTLEDGVLVVVRSVGNDTYDFTLTKEGTERHFQYVDDGRSRDQKTEHLDFDELNAVRAFWLKQQDLI